MQSSKFADIHQFFSRADNHIGGNTEVTRLRTYFLCGLSQLALDMTESGSYLQAGVSSGTSSKVVSHVIDFQSTGRVWWMVDPLDGRSIGGKSRYNTNLETAKAGWNESITTHWVLKPIPEACEVIDDEFAFVHLSTGFFEAEISSLPYFISRLKTRGIIVMDQYGWENIENQEAADRILQNLSCHSFVLPSRQLVIWKA
jgi:hypothetical protein